MTTEVFHYSDIGRILTALASAGADNGPGYSMALRDVALAIGAEVPAVAEKIIEWERQKDLLAALTLRQRFTGSQE